MARRFVPALLAAAAALAVPPAVSAAAPPEVQAVVEAVDPATGRVVLWLTGKSLTRFTGYAFTGPGGDPVLDPPEVILRSKTAVLLRLPAGTPRGEYEVRALPGSGAPVVLPVTVRAGGPWTEAEGNVVRADGRVGVGTASPAAALHVAGPDGVLLGGTLEQGAPPAAGAGTRAAWHPAKAAFRAGHADGDEWDDASTGPFSFAAGRSTVASGIGSVALGSGNLADGPAATALGSGSKAHGAASLAAGTKSSAKQDGGVALGDYASSTGVRAVAIGEGTAAQAFASVALGRYNAASGDGETWTGADPLLVVGNGTEDEKRSNALVLTQAGDLQLAGSLSEKSDARLKTAVRPVAGVLPRLAGVRAVTYEFREGAGPPGRHLGLLAQEVRAAFPELVAEDAGGTLSVAYGKLSAVLLEAIREQQEALDARTREIAALREEVARIRAALGRGR